MKTKNKPNPEKDMIHISWSILILSIFLILVYQCFYQKRIPDYYGYYLLHGMTVVLAISGIYFLFKYGEIKRFSSIDGWLLTAIIVPVVSYLFLSWGEYPLFWDLIFFGLPACSVQFLFYRVMRPKCIKALPLIIAATLSFRNLFILRYTPDLKFELPALCCLIIWTFCYKKSQK